MKNRAIALLACMLFSSFTILSWERPDKNFVAQPVQPEKSATLIVRKSRFCTEFDSTDCTSDVLPCLLASLVVTQGALSGINHDSKCIGELVSGGAVITGITTRRCCKKQTQKCSCCLEAGFFFGIVSMPLIIWQSITKPLHSGCYDE